MTATAGFTVQREKLTQQFQSIFPDRTRSNLRFFFAPGRVNLIGDHIDYCGGMVLPAALRQGTYFAVCPNGIDCIRMHSVNYDETRSFGLADIKYDPQDSWLNYPKGVVNEYHKLGSAVPGMDILCNGDLPLGSALSSSASFLVGTAMITQTLGQHKRVQDPRQMALLCQRAENDFNGLQCGIMDQATAVLGQAGKVLYLNCANLACEYISPQMGNYRLVLLNSNKPRNLTESKYNERKAQVDTVLRILRTEQPGLANLCDLGPDDMQTTLDFLRQWPDDTGVYDLATLVRRTRHVITENLRTRSACTTLKNGEMTRLGNLFTASHHSLDQDYEVSGAELNTLVYESLKHEAVLGARMTGAGFSGCTLSLVEEAAMDDYQTYIAPIYKKKTGLDVSFLTVEFADGASEI